jgi:hypothetical protein
MEDLDLKFITELGFYNGLEVRFKVKTLSSISASMCILDNRLLLQLDYQTFEIPKYYAICTQNCVLAILYEYTLTLQYNETSHLYVDTPQTFPRRNGNLCWFRFLFGRI